MNKLNTFLSGILVGLIVATLGFVIFRTERSAYAEANGEGGGLVLATPSSSSADLGALIYVVRSSPPEDAQLAVYKIEQSKDLHLVSSRRINNDLKLWDYTANGKFLSATEVRDILKKEEDKNKKDDKDKPK